MPLPIIKYPYLPEGKQLLYVPADNVFMKAAQKQAQNYGCRKHSTGAVAVKDNTIIAEGGNAGTFVTVCPRVYKDYGTGQGYEFCKRYCDQEGHAEIMVCKYAINNSIYLQGADLYLYGHWWCCENCWDHMIKAGISNVYLMESSEKIFNYEFQSDDQIDPTPQFKVYISGPLTHLKNPDIKLLYDHIGELVESEGMTPHVPHLIKDPIKHVDITPEEVYQTDTQMVKDADLMICYVGEPSIGVGLEIEMANRYKTLVVLINEKDQNIVHLATGSPNIIEHLTFTDLDDVIEKLRTVLQKFKKTGSMQNISVKL